MDRQDLQDALVDVIILNLFLALKSTAVRYKCTWLATMVD